MTIPDLITILSNIPHHFRDAEVVIEIQDNGGVKIHEIDNVLPTTVEGQRCVNIVIRPDSVGG